MNLTPYILFSLAALFVGAAATLTMPYSRRTVGWVSLAFQTLAGAGFLHVALQVLAHGTFNPERPLFAVAGLGAAFLLKVDALSAVFLLAITVVSWAAGLYSIEYIKHYKESLARYYPLFLLFLLGMYGVVVVRDLFFFIVFWEFMTLTSYGLVVYEWGNRTNVNAGFKYFLMTHIGTAGIIVAANTLYHYSQSFDFESLAPVMALLRTDNPALLHTILLLFFIGFATKAGIFPFGDWLPDAHPAAPAPVSAILSGVMIKMGIYGILRVFLGMLPVSGFSATWGNVFAVFGTISLFIGTMTAMFQHDAKRVLAFHSIGQNGYILLAIGAGLLLAPVSPPLCAIALVAGLYHLVNHAMFKSLLFLTAGSLQYRTGTRDLDRMGGLGRYMPLTAAAAIVAALGISGVPPFNGFASKWLIYHGTVTAGIHTPILLLAGLIALFTSLLTMASVMVKYVGLAFLGQRLPHNQGVDRDVPAGMALPQFLLAALVLLQGVLVVPIVSVLYRAVTGLLTAGYWPARASLFDAHAGGLRLDAGGGFTGFYNPAYLLVALTGLALVAWLFWRSGGSKRVVMDLWYSGEVQSPQAVRYYANSYFKTFKQNFNIRIGRYAQEGVYPAWKLPRVKKPFSVAHLLDIDSWLYRPLAFLGDKALELFSHTHSGFPQWYLLWMVIGAGVALFIMFVVR
ncbi:oxidoreductase [bacterium]|nr:oxidoreductase [bacterium]